MSLKSSSTEAYVRADKVLDGWATKYRISSSYLRDIRSSVVTILDEFTGKVQAELLQLAEDTVARHAEIEACVEHTQDLLEQVVRLHDAHEECVTQLRRAAKAPVKPESFENTTLLFGGGPKGPSLPN